MVTFCYFAGGHNACFRTFYSSMFELKGEKGHNR